MKRKYGDGTEVSAIIRVAICEVSVRNVEKLEKDVVEKFIKPQIKTLVYHMNNVQILSYRRTNVTIQRRSVHDVKENGVIKMVNLLFAHIQIIGTLLLVLQLVGTGTANVIAVLYLVRMGFLHGIVSHQVKLYVPILLISVLCIPKMKMFLYIHGVISSVVEDATYLVF